MDDVKASCLTCRYFVQDGDTTGKCQRSPPNIVCVDDGHDSYWPSTETDRWCGEWMAGNAQQLSAAQAATIYPPIMFSSSNDPLPCYCGANPNVFDGERSRMGSQISCEAYGLHPNERTPSCQANTLALATIMWNAMPRVAH